MNKYQEALNKIKNMGDKDLYNEFHLEWVKTLQELVDKTNPVKPLKKNIYMLNGRKYERPYCPVCYNENIEEGDNYCSECGREIDWS